MIGFLGIFSGGISPKPGITVSSDQMSFLSIIIYKLEMDRLIFFFFFVRSNSALRKIHNDERQRSHINFAAEIFTVSIGNKLHGHIFPYALLRDICLKESHLKPFFAFYFYSWIRFRDLRLWERIIPPAFRQVRGQLDIVKDKAERHFKSFLPPFLYGCKGTLVNTHFRKPDSSAP